MMLCVVPSHLCDLYATSSVIINMQSRMLPRILICKVIQQQYVSYKSKSVFFKYSLILPLKKTMCKAELKV